MDIKIEAFGDGNQSYMRTALNVRFNIFTEELGIDKFTEFDGLDNKATHYLMFVDMNPVGVCRWRKDEDNIIIDRFGIKKEYRGNGYGFLLFKYVLNELVSSKMKIKIVTTKKSIPFFNFLGIKKNVEELDFSEKNFVKFSFEQSSRY